MTRLIMSRKSISTDESSGLEWNTRYEIIKGICSGLNFLHERDIVHLDLKPQNILMDANMIPKIVDFGLSRFSVKQKSNTVTVTFTSKLVGTRVSQLCNNSTYAFLVWSSIMLAVSQNS
jgi:serine/threonine protein kinase